MKNTVLLDDINNGNVAIFEVKENGKFARYEILNHIQIRDLLTMNNRERLFELASLYNFGSITINNEQYCLLCGLTLISNLLVSVAEDIADDVVFSKYIDEENFELFARR